MKRRRYSVTPSDGNELKDQRLATSEPSEGPVSTLPSTPQEGDKVLFVFTKLEDHSEGLNQVSVISDGGRTVTFFTEQVLTTALLPPASTKLPPVIKDGDLVSIKTSAVEKGTRGSTKLDLVNEDGTSVTVISDQIVTISKKKPATATS